MFDENYDADVQKALNACGLSVKTVVPGPYAVTAHNSEIM